MNFGWQPCSAATARQTRLAVCCGVTGIWHGHARRICNCGAPLSGRPSRTVAAQPDHTTTARSAARFSQAARRYNHSITRMGIPPRVGRRVVRWFCERKRDSCRRGMPPAAFIAGVCVPSRETQARASCVSRPYSDRGTRGLRVRHVIPGSGGGDSAGSRWRSWPPSGKDPSGYEVNEPRADRCERDEREHEQRNAGNWRHRCMGSEQNAVAARHQAAVLHVVVAARGGKCCRAERRLGQLPAMGNDELADQRREHDEPHGDEAKPCGKVLAGVQSHDGGSEGRRQSITAAVRASRRLESSRLSSSLQATAWRPVCHAHEATALARMQQLARISLLQ